MSSQKEFGDFQTPLPLAREVVELIHSLMGKPDRVIEPTAGLSSFLEAAHLKWGGDSTYEGYEINPEYVNQANLRLSGQGVKVVEQDFFTANWSDILNAKVSSGRVLLLGNPPWVTNSALGALGSSNSPEKSNFQGLRGFEAKTGKANFDIAEWILIKLIESLPAQAGVAMLCKTMTARKVLAHLWKSGKALAEASLFLIDAKVHFGVSVDACLFYARQGADPKPVAKVYATLSRETHSSSFGLLGGQLVSHIENYLANSDLEGVSPYVWRSGVKHDAAAVMELTQRNGHYLNGLGEEVRIEPNCVYPLLKSSDLGNGRCVARRHVIVTQKRTGDSTDHLRTEAPRTWSYLEKHAVQLDGRKSSIYRNRARFSVFGIGDYSFSLWKVAISGLYKNMQFVVIPPCEGRSIMLDDTCSFIPCGSEREAVLLAELLNSAPCQAFMGSLVFEDSKRPVTVDVLRRVSLFNLAKRLGRLEEFTRYAKMHDTSSENDHLQLSLVMEKPAKPYHSANLLAEQTV